MKFDWQDLTLRVLIVAAGAVAAALLAIKGQAQSLPFLAAGGTLGAVMMTRFGPSEE